MGSISNEGGADEVKKTEKKGEEKLSENSSVGMVEEIKPLDVKDYEDLGLILELEELGAETSHENASINFNTMFSDFFPDDELEKEKIDLPPVVLPATGPSLLEFEKWMDLDPPELKLGWYDPSLSGDPSNWDFELMEWICYEEFLRFYQGQKPPF